MSYMLGQCRDKKSPVWQLECWALATQKILMGGGSFSGIRWSFVFWCVLFVTSHSTSYSCFQTMFWRVFVDIICIFFYTHYPYFMCHCTEYKLSALQVRISEETISNATTQQLITAKISGCAWKPIKHTHHCVREIHNSKMRLRWCLVEYEKSRCL